MRDGRNPVTAPAAIAASANPGTRRRVRGSQSAPASKPRARPVARPARPRSAGQAQARSKARKAKSPRVVRLPLRQRLRARVIERLAGVDLRPQALLARVPFVVVVIGSLGIGLGITLWLSTDAAQRSYQLGSARAVNEALAQQKEALERDVLQAESAPALAEAARDLGMIPSRDTAHLVLDPAGNWVVVGQPKPAQGVPPPPLNTKLPEDKPQPSKTVPPPVAYGPGAEVPVRLVQPVPPSGAMPGSAGPEMPVHPPAVTDPANLQASMPVLPGPAPMPAAPVPAPDPALAGPILADPVLTEQFVAGPGMAEPALPQPLPPVPAAPEPVG